MPVRVNNEILFYYSSQISINIFWILQINLFSKPQNDQKLIYNRILKKIETKLQSNNSDDSRHFVLRLCETKNTIHIFTVYNFHFSGQKKVEFNFTTIFLSFFLHPRPPFILILSQFLFVFFCLALKIDIVYNNWN